MLGLEALTSLNMPWRETLLAWHQATYPRTVSPLQRRCGTRNALVIQSTDDTLAADMRRLSEAHMKARSDRAPREHLHRVTQPDMGRDWGLRCYIQSRILGRLRSGPKTCCETRSPWDSGTEMDGSR